MNITETFIKGLMAQSQAIPSQVFEQARKCLLDYLGVAVGGARYLQKKHFAFFETFTKDQGNSSVFGMSQKTTATNSALLNGFCAHVLELDDGHRYGMIHLGASIITAILNVSEKERLDYNSILRGIVMGYEVAVRCARSIQPGHKVRGYHVSGTCGTIGSAMGIALSCGYNKNQLRATLACAVSSAAGILEIQEDASELKPYNVGRAAMDGLVAAQVGRLALPGPDDVLGGKCGFLVAFTDIPHLEMLTDFSSGEYGIMGIYQKVHAACRHCHPAIDAILAIRNDIHLKPEQVEKIDVHTYRLAVRSHDHTQIRGISSAKLSTPFSIALAILKGSAGYTDYNNSNMNDYWIKYLTNKVSVIVDDKLTAQSPTVRGARVDIYLKNGSFYESSCLYPVGEPEHPLTKGILETKFRELAMYGGLSRSECDEVISEVWGNEFSIEKIVKLTCKK